MNRVLLSMSALLVPLVDCTHAGAGPGGTAQPGDAGTTHASSGPASLGATTSSSATFSTSGVPGPRVSAVAAGRRHTCALVQGAAYCWGDNAYGALGLPPGGTHLAPVRVPGIDDADEVSCGSGFTCVRHHTGRVSCFGENAAGQLGDGTNTDSAAPVPVSGIVDAVGLGVGAYGYHVCAVLASGAVTCWGSNSQGQLGNGNFTRQNVPAVVPGLSGVTHVASGSATTCAIAGADGSVRCWGDNHVLGDGSTASRPSPGQVPGLTDVTHLSVGQLHACALLSDGTAHCWGLDTNGQFGAAPQSPPTNHATPVEVAGLAGTAIAAGMGMTCSVQSSGRVSCIGANQYGQLGDGSTTDSSTPVVPNVLDAVGIAAGAGHTCALTIGGGLACWGANASGQLGIGSTNAALVPTQVHW